MNKWHLAWIIPAVFVIFGIITVGMLDGADDAVATEVTPYWACMDGCFNMIETIYGNVTDENYFDLKEKHALCTLRCCNQYTPSFGCSGLEAYANGLIFGGSCV